MVHYRQQNPCWIKLLLVSANIKDIPSEYTHTTLQVLPSWGHWSKDKGGGEGAGGGWMQQPFWLWTKYTDIHFILFLESYHNSVFVWFGSFINHLFLQLKKKKKERKKAKWEKKEKGVANKQ